MSKRKKNKHSDGSKSRDGVRGEQPPSASHITKSIEKKQHGGSSSSNPNNNKFHKYKKNQQDGGLSNIPLHKRQKLEGQKRKKVDERVENGTSLVVVEKEEEIITRADEKESFIEAEAEESDKAQSVLSPFISRLIVVAGTYDGVLVGWDSEAKKHNQKRGDTKQKDGVDDKMLQYASGSSSKDPLQISFALAAHEGSVRALEITSKYDDNKKDVVSKRDKHEKNDGWEEEEGDDGTFAVHERYPSQLMSAGYDEFIRVFDLHRHREAGEARSPAELGTPLCLALAPPPSAHGKPPTHAVVGLTSGKLVLYSLGASRGKRKEDPWSVVHVMSGHSGSSASSGISSAAGVSCVAVHPSGKLALTGGRADGTIRVWDLMRGRLAFVHKLPAHAETSSSNQGVSPTSARSRMIKREISHIKWSKDGSRFAFCYGCHLTVREMSTGDDLLDVELNPKQKINGITFLGQHDAPEGLFVAVVCDNGSLCVFCVGDLDSALNNKSSSNHSDDDDSDNDDEDVKEEEKQIIKEPPMIRGIEAIEGVDRLVVGNDRYKCIQGLDDAKGYLVVTANTGGIISVINLECAVRMLLSDDDIDDDDNVDNDDDSEESDSENEDVNSPNVSKSSKRKENPSNNQMKDLDYSSDQVEDIDDEEEVAAEFLTSVRVGSGARITNLAVWSDLPEENNHEDEEDDGAMEDGGQTDDPIGEIDTAMYSSSNEDESSDEDDDEISKKNKKRKKAKQHNSDTATHKQTQEQKRKKMRTTTSTGRAEDILNVNEEELANARKLVEEAKKRQRKAKKKKKQ